MYAVLQWKDTPTQCSQYVYSLVLQSALPSRLHVCHWTSQTRRNGNASGQNPTIPPVRHPPPAPPRRRDRCIVASLRYAERQNRGTGRGPLLGDCMACRLHSPFSPPRYLLVLTNIGGHSAISEARRKPRRVPLVALFILSARYPSMALLHCNCT